jgi:dihydrofolate reductase
LRDKKTVPAKARKRKGKEHSEMRKIFWQVNTTLDGYMEDAEGNLTYTAGITDPDFEKYASEMLTHIDGYIIGRKTYEMFVDYWPKQTGPDADLLNSLPKYVVSTTLRSADWNNTRLIKEDLLGEIAKLKRQVGRDIAVFGSADLAASLIKLGMIDDYRIFVTPYILGSGKRTFGKGLDVSALRLAKSEVWKSGTAALFYEQSG